MLMVHLRLGSYLLAPTTIDPSRTNNTASSRFPSQMTRLLSIATRLQTRLQAPRGPIWITGDTRSRRTRAMEQKKRDEAVQETKGIKRRSRSEPCRSPRTHTHHGPHLFAVFNAADGTIDKKAKKPKAQAAPIRSHQPLPTRSQYPAARSSRPVRRPATAHDAEKVNAASDASPAKASAGIFEEKKRH